MPDPRPAIASFLRTAAAGGAQQSLVVPDWDTEDWERLFAHARPTTVRAGEVLIRKNASERALYFLASGLLEVTTVSTSHTLAPIIKIRPGSVVGEIAFLDGEPRTAKVWAVNDSELWQLDYDDFQRFADQHPRQACDLAIGLGRVLAQRLRQQQARAER